MKGTERKPEASVSRSPSPRFLRFARALALASGVAPFGCGGVAALSDDARPAVHEGGPMGVLPQPGGAADVSPGPDGTTVVVGGYDGGVSGIRLGPPGDAMADGLPYDGFVVGVVVMGVQPTPDPDAAVDGGGLDARGADAVIERIPVGGPQPAPAWPLAWQRATVG